MSPPREPGDREALHTRPDVALAVGADQIDLRPALLRADAQLDAGLSPVPQQSGIDPALVEEAAIAPELLGEQVFEAHEHPSSRRKLTGWKAGVQSFRRSIYAPRR